MENENIKKSNKKEIIITILSVLILIVSIIGISYSIWTQTFLGTKENSINTGYLSFSYKESDTNVIEIHNAVPMSDTNGKMLTGNTNMFDFTVSATFSGIASVGYEIFATPINTTLDGKYIKMYLTNQNDQAINGFDGVVPTYSELKDTEDGTSKIIYTSSLTESGNAHDYRLRIWVGSDYNMPEDSRSFSFKVNVKGIA